MQVYTTIFSGGKAHNQVREFVVDDANALSNINISQLLPGSRVFVIDDSQWYMLKHDKTWSPVNWGSSGGGGGGGETFDSLVCVGKEETISEGEG